jgi:hypothetical protein
MASSTTSKVKTIVEDTGLTTAQVTTVLYSYLTWCIQEVLIQGYSQTIFGKLTLDENNRLELMTDKEGLISLLDKHDIKILRKIVEQGSDYNIF